VAVEVVASFAQTLKQHRKALDLTQEELARRVGCAAVTIQRIEQGTLRPSRQILDRLADIFGLPSDQRESFARLGRSGLFGKAPVVSEQADDLDGSLVSQALPPVPLTPLIGRAREVAAVCQALENPAIRVLTLTGPGGIGKTRLALQAAVELQAAFADGVVFVDLAPIRDSALVPATIARALGLPDAGEQPLIARLQAALRPRQLLLVLDNFEQVVVAAPIVADLLQAARQLKILLTSRAVVGVYGEQDYPVPPLALPDLRSLPPLDQLIEVETVRLFVERAQAAQPDFHLTASNAHTVSAICQYLEGLPLAIELAAARVRLFTPAALLTRLVANGTLPLLTSGPRTLPVRQQTIRATIAWSYDLLEQGARALFCRLGVFNGGCDLAAAEAVGGGDPISVGQVPALVETLVAHNLVKVVEGREGEPRFNMLETIREFAQERMRERGEEAKLQQRHADHYLALVEAAEPELWGSRQVERCNQLEREIANLRAALSYFVANGQLEQAARLAAALRLFWIIRDRVDEGRAVLEIVLSAPLPLTPTARAKALHARGHLVTEQVYQDEVITHASYEESLRIYRAVGAQHSVGLVLADLCWIMSASIWPSLDPSVTTTAARAYAEESLAIGRALGDRRIIANALFALAEVERCRTGDLVQATTLHHEALGYRRALGAPYDIAWSLLAAAVVATNCGDLEAGQALHLERLAVERQLGHVRGILGSLNALGRIAIQRCDYLEALSFHEEERRMSAALAPDYVVDALCGLARAAFAQGRYAEAEAYLADAFEQAQGRGDYPMVASVHLFRGEIAVAQGDLELADAHYDLAVALADEHHLEPVYAAVRLRRGVTAYYRGEYTVAREIQEAEVARCRTHAPLDLAEALQTLGATYCALGEIAKARTTLAESLRGLRAKQALGPLARCLELIAATYANPAIAVRLWGAAAALREQIGIPLWPVDCPEHQRRVESARAALGDTGFVGVWAEARELPLEQILDSILSAASVDVLA
jgi:predicted ATPase/transcriptional regulator with XRE-family HTH domain